MCYADGEALPYIPLMEKLIVHTTAHLFECCHRWGSQDVSHKYKPMAVLQHSAVFCFGFKLAKTDSIAFGSMERKGYQKWIISD